MLFKLLNGAASPANCAKNIAGPLIVLIVPSTQLRRCCAFLRQHYSCVAQPLLAVRLFCYLPTLIHSPRIIPAWHSHSWLCAKPVAFSGTATPGCAPNPLPLVAQPSGCAPNPLPLVAQPSGCAPEPLTTSRRPANAGSLREPLLYSFSIPKQISGRCSSGRETRTPDPLVRSATPSFTRHKNTQGSARKPTGNRSFASLRFALFFRCEP